MNAIDAAIANATATAKAVADAIVTFEVAIGDAPWIINAGFVTFGVRTKSDGETARLWMNASHATITRNPALWVTCPDCDGKGMVYDIDYDVCKRCGGEGEVLASTMAAAP